MRRTLLLVLVLAILAAVGCGERDARTRARTAGLLLQAAAKPAHPLDIAFDDKVELLGYDLDSAQLSPDKPFEITWYWRVRAPLGDGVQLFTHLVDGQGTTRLNLDGERSLRDIYPEARWQAGDLIRDKQIVRLPADWSSPVAAFYLGFYKGEQRFEVKRGEHDAERRAIGARVPVGLAAPPVPELKVPRARGKIALDGKLDEADWLAAPSTGPLVQTFSGAPGEFKVNVRMLYDAERVYIAFEVDDDYLKSTFQNTDDHLWEQDTVEVMFDPDGDAKNYFELQVSPRGMHFDTRYDSRRKPRPFGHVDWDSQVQAGVTVRGTLDDASADGGYTVELAVPFTAFAAGETPASPPQPGSNWRVNFFVMDAREQGQRAVAWSPPRVGDFHILDRFGRVQFEP
ncbi:MAG TPA: carbohydrate-binding family 9-like protein [Polyangiales bacterium]|nr:carbohydrate-binding family 9-like protein [Polyangiales bacterium]